MEYEPVIGLEVHAELKTESKMFCGCSTKFGSSPNSNVCPVCMGFPGVLPVINKKAIEFAIKTALALNCRVAGFSKFDRKNYYYPDLPKNYQISQYDIPVSNEGHIIINVNGVEKNIRITRVHLEEDAGKNLHADDTGLADASLVDLNRAGVPLIEIVSEPDLRSTEEVDEYMNALKAVLQYIDVSDCKMEEGSLRFEANVSVREKGTEKFGTKVEIKNLNSFKFLVKSLEYEIDRQKTAIEKGERIVQETRLWDGEKTLPMRSKEEAKDYRYFPEPDLVGISISKEWIEKIKLGLPELPIARKKRYTDMGLSDYDAQMLVRDKETAEYFEQCLKKYNNAKTLANWITVELMALLNKSQKTVSECLITPAHLAEMLELKDNGTISGKIAKTVFEEMFENGKMPSEIVKEKGLVQITDENELLKIVEEAISASPKAVEEIQKGKDKPLGFIVGQVMKISKGKANPDSVNRILREKFRGFLK